MTEIQCFQDEVCLKCENVVLERLNAKYYNSGNHGQHVTFWYIWLLESFMRYFCNIHLNYKMIVDGKIQSSSFQLWGPRLAFTIQYIWLSPARTSFVSHCGNHGHYDHLCLVLQGQILLEDMYKIVGHPKHQPECQKCSTWQLWYVFVRASWLM